MKTRRHHNNKGLRTIKLGKTEIALKRVSKKLKVKYRAPGEEELEEIEKGFDPVVDANNYPDEDY